MGYAQKSGMVMMKNIIWQLGDFSNNVPAPSLWQRVMISIVKRT